MSGTAGDRLSRIDLAAEFLRRTSPLRPFSAAVLGSGLGGAVSLEGALEIPYGNIPGWPVSRVPGHPGVLTLGTVEGTPAALLHGRIHLYEGWSADEVAFPVRVLARLGAERIVLTNSSGGIGPRLAAGDILVVRDHINLTGANPLRGDNLDALGPRFPDCTAVYDAVFARACAARAKVAVREGVYAALAGPSFETPAEIRMLRAVGADAVGMSTVPEAIAARHAGLQVLAFSVIGNRAAGLSKRPLTHREVLEASAGAQERMGRLLIEALRRTPRGSRSRGGPRRGGKAP